MLKQDIERFIGIKHALGLKFDGLGRQLRHFADFAEAAGDTFVRADRAVEWAAGAVSANYRRRKLMLVRQFALAMRSEDARHEVPSAAALGSGHYVRPPPYIYTPDEITRLIEAAGRLGPAGSIRPVTYTTYFGLLAATGMRFTEALSLRVDDMTPDGLLIRETKFRKTRLLPLHETTAQALAEYLRARTEASPLTDALFIARSRRAPHRNSVRIAFAEMIRSVGLEPGPGERGPRIHDLRHTFAVNALLQCPPGRAAASHHMVALSTYLGHSNVSDTYWYLQATPVLMAKIADSCETFFMGGKL